MDLVLAPGKRIKKAMQLSVTNLYSADIRAKEDFGGGVIEAYKATRYVTRMNIMTAISERYMTSMSWKGRGSGCGEHKLSARQNRRITFRKVTLGETESFLLALPRSNDSLRACSSRKSWSVKAPSGQLHKNCLPTTIFRSIYPDVFAQYKDTCWAS